METDPHIPRPAIIRDRIEETPTIFTLRLEPEGHSPLPFKPGQFNMVGVFGLGEVPLSIVSDPSDVDFFDHTIRIVGRVTGAMARLGPGDRVSIRGPFGNGWPMDESRGRDIVLVSGGLGCAPLVSVVNYVVRRREEFGSLTVLHGVKNPGDLFWKERLSRLNEQEGTRVFLTSDEGGAGWEGAVGPVTDLIPNIPVTLRTTAKICGPEPMMLSTVRKLRDQGIPEDDLWVSLERNMQCAAGFCGHCQLGEIFVCRGGPVFRYAEIKHRLGIRGL
ncbi:MAG: FAD/NAD(P)-binding protein [Nitrospirae bacterium]|nr:FAD/NAD(P)-binding protein [Nitrospirota bacterium]